MDDREAASIGFHAPPSLWTALIDSDVLAWVFSYLAKEELIRISRVSKLFLQTIDDARLWVDLDLTSDFWAAYASTPWASLPIWKGVIARRKRVVKRLSMHVKCFLAISSLISSKKKAQTPCSRRYRPIAPECLPQPNDLHLVWLEHAFRLRLPQYISKQSAASQEYRSLR